MKKVLVKSLRDLLIISWLSREVDEERLFF